MKLLCARCEKEGKPALVEVATNRDRLTAQERP